MFKVREPPDAFNPYEMIAAIIHAPSSRLQRIFLWDSKFTVAAMYALAQPQVVSVTYVPIQSVTYVRLHSQTPVQGRLPSPAGKNRLPLEGESAERWYNMRLKDKAV